jgi:orotidine-5'-phosphate decarboxylase
VTTRVYVNERAVDVPPGESAAAAVRAADAELGEALAGGRAYLTDGRGVRIAPDAVLEAGAILRVVRSIKPGGDAHA